MKELLSERPQNIEGINLEASVCGGEAQAQGIKTNSFREIGFKMFIVFEIYRQTDNNGEIKT